MQEILLNRLIYWNTDYPLHWPSLLFNSPRFEKGSVYFCCPFYSFNAGLPPGIKSVVPLSPRSPFPAPLLPPGQCGNVTVRPPRIVGGNFIKVNNMSMCTRKNNATKQHQASYLINLILTRSTASISISTRTEQRTILNIDNGYFSVLLSTTDNSPDLLIFCIAVKLFLCFRNSAIPQK